MSNIGVLLAAGLGQRFSENVQKQYVSLCGKEVISYGIDAFKSSALTDDFIVVVDKEIFENGYVSKKYNVKCIEGGNSRAKSFDNALKYIKNNFSDCEKVIFHEAARPLIKPSVFDDYFKILDDYDYIETCAHITDSLGYVGEKVPNREDFFLIQAPEAYRFNLLYENFDVKNPIYFAAHQLPKNARGYKNFEIGPNFKLTYSEDLQLLEYFISSKNN